MASVPVTLDGVVYDLQDKSAKRVVFIGEASLSGLSVGGGPVIPPAGEKPPEGKPPGIWGGPIDPYPGHPLPVPPEKPPGNPPGIWGGPIDPYPGHPLPEPPGKPPEPINPPVSWKAVWHPTDGWIVVGLINPEVPHPVPSQGQQAPPVNPQRP